MIRWMLTTQGRLVPARVGEYVAWSDVRPLLRTAASMMREMNRLMPREDVSLFLERLNAEHRIDEI